MAAYDWRTDPFGYMGDNSPNFIAAGQPEFQRNELNNERQRIQQGGSATYNPINAGLFANQADYDINKTSDYNKFVAGLDRTQAGPHTGPYTNNPTLKWNFLDQTSNAIPTENFRLPTYEDDKGVVYPIRPGMTPPPGARNVTPNWEKLISGGPAAMGNPGAPTSSPTSPGRAPSLPPIPSGYSDPSTWQTLSGGMANAAPQVIKDTRPPGLPTDGLGFRATPVNNFLSGGVSSLYPAAGPANQPYLTQGGDMIVRNPNYNMGPMQSPSTPQELKPLPNIERISDTPFRMDTTPATQPTPSYGDPNWRFVPGLIDYTTLPNQTTPAPQPAPATNPFPNFLPGRTVTRQPVSEPVKRQIAPLPKQPASPSYSPVMGQSMDITSNPANYSPQTRPANVFGVGIPSRSYRGNMGGGYSQPMPMYGGGYGGGMMPFNYGGFGGMPAPSYGGYGAMPMRGYGGMNYSMPMYGGGGYGGMARSPYGGYPMVGGFM